MRTGVRILRVNGAAFGKNTLLAAVRDSVNHSIVLTIEQDGRTSDARISYAGPLRYPRLERIPDRTDTLARLLAPR
jgi:hypothetical protein